GRVIRAVMPAGAALGTVIPFAVSSGSTTQYQECLDTPFQCIAERPGLTATAWYIYTAPQINPFASAGGPTITGHVVDANGSPLSGVTIAISANPSNATIAPDGSFRVALDLDGHSYTITPSISAYVFNPVAANGWNNSNVTVNFGSGEVIDSDPS